MCSFQFIQRLAERTRWDIEREMRWDGVPTENHLGLCLYFDRDSAFPIDHGAVAAMKWLFLIYREQLMIIMRPLTLSLVCSGDDRRRRYLIWFNNNSNIIKQRTTGIS